MSPLCRVPGTRHNDGMEDRNDRTHQIDAAMAVRRLAHALVAHEATDTLLSRIAELYDSNFGLDEQSAFSNQPQAQKAEG